MNVSLEIPDDLGRRLASRGEDLSRRALEGFALEEYKAGRVGNQDVDPAIGLSRGRVKWSLWPSALQWVPWADPWLNAKLELMNDLVR